jgi:hypothetical protein
MPLDSFDFVTFLVEKKIEENRFKFSVRCSHRKDKWRQNFVKQA